MARCSGKTKSGDPCRRKAPKGQRRCWQHNPLARTKRVARLGVKVAERVALTHAVINAGAALYVKLDPLIQPILNWIIPETFWFEGYLERDQDRMDTEVVRARDKLQSLEARCSSYSVAELQRLEQQLQQVLRALDTLD